jgi:hypothetical protein
VAAAPAPSCAPTQLRLSLAEPPGLARRQQLRDASFDFARVGEAMDFVLAEQSSALGIDVEHTSPTRDELRVHGVAEALTQRSHQTGGLR